MVGFQNCRALVVDDDEAVAAIVSSILEDGGATVETAESGETALEMFTANVFDIVITDIRMHGMDGFELVKKLRLIDTAVTVVMMTGYDSYDSVYKALQCGAYDYLQKPLNNHPAVLVSAQRAYENSRLLRENADLLVELKESHQKLAIANRKLLSVNQKLKRFAVSDSLTELFNRRYFDQVLKREVSRRNRYNTEISLVLIDIDDFKRFNDDYGHAAGDTALRQVGAALLDCARTSDIAARYSGEVFAVLLPQTLPENAAVFAERFRKKVASEPIELAEGNVSLTVSLGVSGIHRSEGTMPAEQLMALADSALYRAKADGKNCYRITVEGDDLKRVA